MRVLVTGGAGYIGSHTCLCLLAAGHQVMVADNLSNSRREALRRVEKLAGRAIGFSLADLRSPEETRRLFAGAPVDAVIHFAGLKAVGESVTQPLRYYGDNLACTLNLLQAMGEYGVRRLIFSSSATVYGTPQQVPIPETAPLAPANPYGQTKAMAEQMLQDLCRADRGFCAVALRYFNPVGAHESGLMGEDPLGVPNNLFPYIARVAAGQLPQLTVFGDDYPTADGTGVRDYIHVMDLAQGHVAALERLGQRPGFDVYNLGTGRGYSVRQVLCAFEKAAGRPVPYKVGPRRAGDVAVCYADCQKARQELGWQARRGLAAMCADAWRWQQQNPAGYPEG